VGVEVGGSGVDVKVGWIVGSGVRVMLVAVAEDNRTVGLAGGEVGVACTCVGVGVKVAVGRKGVKVMRSVGSNAGVGGSP
jgi:hypothetical protein